MVRSDAITRDELAAALPWLQQWVRGVPETLDRAQDVRRAIRALRRAAERRGMSVAEMLRSIGVRR